MQSVNCKLKNARGSGAIHRTIRRGINATATNTKEQSERGKRMQAEVISIGTELLLGQAPETNSLYITQKLNEVGIEVHYKTVVGDNQIDIENILRKALTLVDVIIITGGLGPTLDDLTRKVAAKVLERKLVLDQKSLREIEEHFRKRDLSMFPQSNITQAYVPQGARILSNSLGSAPGFITEQKGKTLVFLPGPPREMKPMLAGKVIPFLEKKYKIRRFIKSSILRTYGLPESALEEKIKDIIREEKNPLVGFAAHQTGVDIKIIARASTKKMLDGLINKVEAKITERLGDYIFGQGKQTMEEVIGYLLYIHKLTIAVAESCTGGLISHRLTNISGSSHYYKQGVVCYSNEAKMNLLGVSSLTIDEFGAVSSQTACAMAKAVRNLSKTNLGLGITGIAGPTGGTSAKPVGLVYVALADGKTTASCEFKFTGNREEIKTKTSQAALNIVRKYLLDY